MDEPSQGGMVEDVARGHLVACSGNCPVPTIGRNGGALGFDGSVFLSTVQTADLDPSSGFTIATWVNLAAPSVSARTAMITKTVATGGADTYALFVNTADLLSVFEIGGVQAGGPMIALGVWRHIAMSSDGTRIRGYVDGAVVADIAASLLSDSHDVLFGADDNAPITHFLIGALDDVMIFSRALTDGEVAELAR